MKLQFFFFILVFSFWAGQIFANSSEKENKVSAKISLQKEIIKLSQNGGVILGSPDKITLFQYQATKEFIPASIVKILIAAAALDILGKDFRFSTQFYRDKEQNLLIKGGGDPFFISEEIDLAAKELYQKKWREFSSIFLDDSLIQTIKVPGLGKSLNSYDALSGALVVNFNTLFLEKTADGKILSAEDWTPLTPLAKKKAKVIANSKKKRINLGNNYEDSLRYTAELTTAIFAKNNIKITNEGYQKTLVDGNWELILEYKNTKNLYDILPSFLLYSNNYIANQIYFRLGASKYQSPYNLEKSNRVMKEYLNQQPILKDSIFLEEGSGLSRKNKITPQATMYFLHKLTPEYKIFPKEKNYFSKTGTLKNVYNLAGYILYKDKLHPFCIFINNQSNQRDAILGLLQKWLKIHYS